jgi:ribosomal 50S subunit-recycling heat shock protein
LNLAESTKRKTDAETRQIEANTEFIKAQTQQAKSKPRFILTVVVVAAVSIGTLTVQIWQGHQSNVAKARDLAKAAIDNQRAAIDNESEKNSLFVQAIESLKKAYPELTQAYEHIRELERERETDRKEIASLKQEAFEKGILLIRNLKFQLRASRLVRLHQA